MRTRIVLLILIAFISCSKDKDKKPNGFDSFWQEAINELDTLVMSEKVKDSIVDGKKWVLYKIKSYNNVNFYSWVSEPLVDGKFPIKVRFSSMNSGVINKNIIQNDWFLKEADVINMLVDVRGQGLSIDKIKNTDFLTNGLEDKQTYIYKGAYLDAIKAVDFISNNPKADGNIIVLGGGQGGTLALAATAFNKKVTMCVVGFPFFTDISSYNKKEWPMCVFMFYCYKYEKDYFDILHTLSYFDMIYFADKIKTPIFIRTEKKDKITPPEGTVKFFNQVKSEKKEMYIEPCEGHGCSTNSEKANALEKMFIKKNMIQN